MIRNDGGKKYSNYVRRQISLILYSTQHTGFTQEPTRPPDETNGELQRRVKEVFLFPELQGEKSYFLNYLFCVFITVFVQATVDK